MSRGNPDLDTSIVMRIVREGLKEDIGPGDVTTQALISPGMHAIGTLMAQSAGVLAGVPVVQMVYEVLEAGVTWDWLKNEGGRFERGDVLCRFTGDASLVLTGERVALNFLQRLSGIATTTRKYADKLKGTGVSLLDTRKTTPVLRELEKYAVRVGGGENHRRGLYDRVLIKDNHLAVVPDPAEAVERARHARPDLLIEVESSHADGFERALSSRPDWILLDNMTIHELKDCVAKRNAAAPPRPKLEASGGVTLQTIDKIALTGIDAISVGALTHSAPWSDISMEVTL